MPSRRRRAFTLVELLVVIGIIALLVSILLPALNKARKHAVQVQCCSNLRSIGQAVQMYSNANGGCAMPTLVWGPTGDDEWAIFLVAGRYLPDQNLTVTSSPYSRSVLVCPAVADMVLASNIAGVPTVPAGSQSDGFDRRLSFVVKPGLIVDYGYGINGATYRKPFDAVDFNTTASLKVPSTSISVDAAQISPPLKRITKLKNSSRLVTFFDGTEWNAFGTATTLRTRMTSARHGKWDNKNPVTTGITNLLFADGHVVSADRKDLPQTTAEWTGTQAPARNTSYIWNVTQN
jgi:prepilin-type N-terminal cleavage/methylation domain-containing protein/prepilin-type processing-associated H-X9-DG protein